MVFIHTHTILCNSERLTGEQDAISDCWPMVQIQAQEKAVAEYERKYGFDAHH